MRIERAKLPKPAIRGEYEEHGVEGYYASKGSSYRNPHEPVVRQILQEAAHRWRLDLDNVLDLACGSGEATLALREAGARRIDGIDPYTGAAYRGRTGQPAEALSFEEIAAGALEGRRYSLVVCSFALHLLDDSRLPGLLNRLREISAALLVVTPHKRPEIKPEWGWTLVEEILADRVRARLYRVL